MRQNVSQILEQESNPQNCFILSNWNKLVVWDRTNWDDWYYKKIYGKSLIFYVYDIVWTNKKRFILTHKELINKDDIRRDLFWKYRIEIKKILEEEWIILSAKELLQIAISFCKWISGIYDNLEYLCKSTNLSQQQFNRKILEYSMWIKYIPETNLLDSENYSHIDLFSRIYFIETKIIRQSKIDLNKKYNILEIWSSMWNPVISKDNAFNDERIWFLGVDKNMELIKSSLRYIEESKRNNIHFMQLDINSIDSLENLRKANDWNNYDFITCSHLLEHLDDDILAIIKDWLTLVDKWIIISLPIEKWLNWLYWIDVSTHKRKFWIQDIIDIWKSVESWIENIICNYNYINSWILIIQKKENIKIGYENLDKISRYHNISEREKLAIRFIISEKLLNEYFDENMDLKLMFSLILGKDEWSIEIMMIVLREILIQPMASSWWVLRNLKNKYRLDLSVEELKQIYYKFQFNKIIQDLIRFNSSASKVIAVARWVMLKEKWTSYYFDVQLTDICPNKCEKCWQFYRDEKGNPKLIKRILDDDITYPKTDDFRRVMKEIIDMWVESMSTTWGGEPFMFNDLWNLLEEAKKYALSKWRKLRYFIPTSWLGSVFNDETKLIKVIKNLDLIRFSLDSFDKGFLCSTHWIPEKAYDIVINNLRKVIQLSKIHNPSLDIEVLVLMYKDSYKYIEYTVNKAKEMGVTRVLFNTITWKTDIILLDKEIQQWSNILRKIYEKACNGDYYPMHIDFDPLLLWWYSNLFYIDTQNMERPLWNLKYCMKNIFWLTPVVTADWTFHVCFPCSQPLIANKQNNFKIWNIMDRSILELMKIMREWYRHIDPEKDCIKDCRDIPYFNAIIRKVIDDTSLWISLLFQPFLDKTIVDTRFNHSMHDEQFKEGNLKIVVEEMSQATNKVRADQINNFKEYMDHIHSLYTQIISNISEESTVYQIFDRYMSWNLFDIHAMMINNLIYIFSFELEIVYILTTEKCQFAWTFNDVNNNLDIFSKIIKNKREWKILLSWNQLKIF